MKSSFLTPEEKAKLKERGRQLREASPAVQPIDEGAITLALSPDSPYFITTNLWWECECPQFAKSRDMEMCEECGSFRDECPDARIGDLKDQGIHVDWSAPEVTATLDEYNVPERAPALSSRSARRETRGNQE